MSRAVLLMKNGVLKQHFAYIRAGNVSTRAPELYSQNLSQNSMAQPVLGRYSYPTCVYMTL